MLLNNRFRYDFLTLAVGIGCEYSWPDGFHSYARTGIRGPKIWWCTLAAEKERESIQTVTSCREGEKTIL